MNDTYTPSSVVSIPFSHLSGAKELKIPYFRDAHVKVGDPAPAAFDGWFVVAVIPQFTLAGYGAELTSFKEVTIAKPAKLISTIQLLDPSVPLLAK